MVSPLPEASSASIVVVGEFSPSVFRPGWFVKRELLDPADTDDVTNMLVTDDFTAFAANWLTFQVDRQRLQVVTSSEPIVRALDLALGILSHFPETPVRSLGLNHDAHVKMPSQSSMHQLGDILAPKDCWPPEFRHDRPIGDNPPRWAGLRSLIMELPRLEPAGFTHIRIEPSLVIQLGVFFGTNDHYTLGTDGIPGSASEASKLIQERWQWAMTFADEIRTKILESVK